MTNVSVVIPVKDEQELLGKLLSELKKQTLEHEVIVALSPETTDDSEKVARTHGARVVQGGMPAVGRNNGAAVAKGTYIFFLDADVLPAQTHFLEHAVDEMQRRKLSCATVANYVQQPKLRERIFYGLFNFSIRTLNTFGQGYSCGTCIITQSDAHKDIGGFNEHVEFFEDVEYTQRIARKHPYGMLSRKHAILVNPRRMRTDGILVMTWYALRAIWYRKIHGEITDIAVIDENYFSRKKNQTTTPSTTQATQEQSKE